MTTYYYILASGEISGSGSLLISSPDPMSPEYINSGANSEYWDPSFVHRVNGDVSGDPLSGQSWSFSLSAWVFTKSSLHAMTRTTRGVLISGGVTYDGMLFDTTDNTMDNLSAFAQDALLQNVADTRSLIYNPNNDAIAYTNDGVVSAYQAVQNYRQGIIDAEASIYADIESGTITTQTGIDAAFVTYMASPVSHTTLDVYSAVTDLQSDVSDMQTDVSDLGADMVTFQTTLSGLTAPAWTDITGKPSTFAPSAHNHVVADITDYTTATDARIDTKITALIGTAPSTLDTLGELAAAMAADETAASALATAVGNKVDKVTGKVLSANDYTTTEKNKLATITGTNTGDQDLSGKVDKVSGKGLSTNDYDAAAVSKLSGMASGANVNVSAVQGTTVRAGAFPVFKSATVASGVAVFHFTDNGLSTGNALFQTGPIVESVNPIVNDATASYQMGWAWSNSNKTLTVTTNNFTTSNILTGILGQAAANGKAVNVTVYGY